MKLTKRNENRTQNRTKQQHKKLKKKTKTPTKCALLLKEKYQIAKQCLFYTFCQTQNENCAHINNGKTE